jgi:predicted esterase
MDGRLATLLYSNNANLGVSVYEGMGHMINEDEFDSVIKFIND